MSPMSHVVSVTRALALLTGLVTVGCNNAVAPNDSSSPADASDVTTADTSTPSDANTADIYIDAGTSDAEMMNCAACSCVGNVAPDSEIPDTGLPACTGINLSCCAAVGPVAPPDLPA